jgi:hypothetical protein
MFFTDAFVQEPLHAKPLPQPHFPDGAVAVGSSELPYVGPVIHIALHDANGSALCATLSLPAVNRFIESLGAAMNHARTHLGTMGESVQ